MDTLIWSYRVNENIDKYVPNSTIFKKETHKGYRYKIIKINDMFRALQLFRKDSIMTSNVFYIMQRNF